MYSEPGTGSHSHVNDKGHSDCFMNGTNSRHH